MTFSLEDTKTNRTQRLLKNLQRYLLRDEEPTDSEIDDLLAELKGVIEWRENELVRWGFITEWADGEG